MRCPYYTGVRKTGFDYTFQPDLPVNNQILTFPFVSIFASSLPACFVSSSSEVFSRLPSSWSRCDSLEPASETVSSPSVVSSSFLCLLAFSGWDVVFENQPDVDFLELLEAKEYDVYYRNMKENVALSGIWNHVPPRRGSTPVSTVLRKSVRVFIDK